MSKLEKLPPEIEARLPDYVREWTGYGLSTEPADRSRAEAAIRWMYAQAGLAEPRIVWTTSPMASALTRAILLDKNAEVRDSVWDSVCGQHDANWLAFYRVFHDAGLTAQTEKLHGLWELCQSAGWALPHEKICWVSERHNVLKSDDAGRLHCPNGPALQYPDGWSIYAWHGTRAPQEWFEGKLPTAAEALQWPNAEQRRVACEMLGWAKILRELNAKEIDRHANPMIGTLVEATLPDNGPQRFLRVMCGTGREFALCVPNTVKTAIEAQSLIQRIPPELVERIEVRT